MASYTEKKDPETTLSCEIEKLAIHGSEGEESALSSKLSEVREVEKVDETKFMTPTDMEVKIQEPLTCPGAPRKRRACLFGNENKSEKMTADSKDVVDLDCSGV